jgi:hypothetical protein
VVGDDDRFSKGARKGGSALDSASLAAAVQVTNGCHTHPHTHTLSLSLFACRVGPSLSAVFSGAKSASSACVVLSLALQTSGEMYDGDDGLDPFGDMDENLTLDMQVRASWTRGKFRPHADGGCFVGAQQMAMGDATQDLSAGDSAVGYLAVQPDGTYQGQLPPAVRRCACAPPHHRFTHPRAELCTCVCRTKKPAIW